MKYLLLLLLLVSCTQEDTAIKTPYNMECKIVNLSLSRIERCKNQEVVCYLYDGRSIWCMPRGAFNE
jgi:hypothetical protein